MMVFRVFITNKNPIDAISGVDEVIQTDFDTLDEAIIFSRQMVEAGLNVALCCWECRTYGEET